MLILSRKTAETICLPELGIKIRVLQIRGQNVSLGLDAPQEVRILRGEIEEARSESWLRIYPIPRSA